MDQFMKPFFDELKYSVLLIREFYDGLLVALKFDGI